MTGRKKVKPMINRKLLATTAFALAGILPALARAATPETAAGTDITLSASVDYKVGTTDQKYTAPDVVIKTDRKVRMEITNAAHGSGSYKTDVSPNKTAWSLVTFQNLSNDNLDFKLEVSSADTPAGPTAKIYLDKAPLAAFGQEDELVTSLSQVPQDGSRSLFVVIDVPKETKNKTTYKYNITATAYAKDTVNVAGAVPLATSTTQTDDVIDTVLAEAGVAALNDPANDGKLVNQSVFTVKAPDLTSLISSRVLWAPKDESTNPQLIPGAIWEYCVGWKNATDAGTATEVFVSTTLPSTLTLITDSVFVADYGTDQCTKRTDWANFAVTVGPGDQLKQWLPDIPAGESRVAIFKATVK